MLIRTLAFAALLATAGPVFAQPAAEGPPPGGEAAGRGHGAMQACAADRKTYCADVERGGGRVFKCLRDNLTRLSPACQGAVQSMREHRREGGVAAPGLYPPAQPPSCRRVPPTWVGEFNMLGIIAVILVIGWLLGFFVFHVSSFLIHILLIIAVIMIVMHFMRGRGSSI